MTTKKDYYEILGVPRTADDKQIKAAYRKLARKHHPDVNKGEKRAEERFKEVAEAFAVLSDKEKRATYDRGGHEAFGAGFNPFAGSDVHNFDFGFGNLGDLFSMFTGFSGPARSGRSSRRATRGADLRLELRIPFMDALRGSTVDIQIPRQRACDVCGGSGFETGMEKACPDCAGRGRTEQRRHGLQVSLTCSRCGGAGRLAGPPCAACSGSGTTGTKGRVKVRIPKGSADGDTLRLVGKGNSGSHGAPAGDAFLTLRVQPDPVFRREGQNLYCEAPIGLAKAALGGKVAVRTLDGESTINIPPGTRSGQKFRLKGKGVPGARGRATGDLYALIQIHPPQELDARSRELLEELQRLHP